MFGIFKIRLFWDIMLCSQLSPNISEETAVSTCKVKGISNSRHIHMKRKSQCGFRCNRSSTDHIICICHILRREWEYSEAVHQIFIDLERAYNSFMREVLYNILTEFGIPMEPVRLIKMGLIETYSRVWVGKHLSDMCPVRNGLKQGDAVWPLLFNFASEYDIRKYLWHNQQINNIVTNITDYIRLPHMIITLWYNCNSSNHLKNCAILLYFIES